MKTKCPKCNKSDEVGEYFYGHMSFKHVQELSEKGDVYGGDIIYEDASPEFHCHRCSYNWRTDGNKCGF